MIKISRPNNDLLEDIKQKWYGDSEDTELAFSSSLGNADMYTSRRKVMHLLITCTYLYFSPLTSFPPFLAIHHEILLQKRKEEGVAQNELFWARSHSRATP